MGRLLHLCAPPLLVLTLASCSPGGSSIVAASHPTASPAAAIRHIVVIVQENRSFDNLFAGYPGADAPAFGYSGGSKVPLRPIRLESPFILENNWRDAIAAWDRGAMDGFANEHYSGSGPPLLAYAVVPRRESAPYWAMARQYALGDRMFPTEFGPSFTAHLNLIGGNTELAGGDVAEVDFPTAVPWGCDAPAGTVTATLTKQRVEAYNGPFPCFLTCGPWPTRWMQPACRGATTHLLSVAVSTARRGRSSARSAACATVPTGTR